MFLDGDLNADPTVSAGHLLISEPFLPDPNFERTVVLLCQHQDAAGTFGLVLNKPTSVYVYEATDLKSVREQLYIGGPVEQNTLHFVHSVPDLPNSTPLKDGLYWGGDLEHFQSLAEVGQVQAGQCRFFAGYSGWSAHQLAGEIEANSWIIARVSLADILAVDPAKLWAHILKEMGGKYRAYANFPEDPRLN
jgi:putative transcriptional regulator